jgi:hypothetical protein
MMMKNVFGAGIHHIVRFGWQSKRLVLSAIAVGERC